MWIDYNSLEYDVRKQPFNERLVEMVRGKRDNVFGIMYDEVESIPKNPICVQYNYKQKPKSSFGIAFHNVRTKKWFVVEPTLTIEMRLLLQGTYSMNLIPFLVEQLYRSELEAIISYDGKFPEFYKSLERVMPRSKLAETIWNSTYPTLLEMAKRMLAYREHTGNQESQYIFPKGRPDDSEVFFLTALREVEEETGIKVLFENPDISVRQLSRHGHVSGLADVFGNDQTVKQKFWEYCRLNIPGIPLVDGYVCKEYVSHTHSDMTGKMYKTTLWVCVFDGEDSEDIPMKRASETRLGRWISEADLRRQFRVQELYQKCEITLNKYFPYLSL
jgi:8-oxo-dGTP pyrophosphatase MutT (NUDIX family)